MWLRGEVQSWTFTKSTEEVNEGEIIVQAISSRCFLQAKMGRDEQFEDKGSYNEIRSVGEKTKTKKHTKI